jgi:hypothetical protein
MSKRLSLFDRILSGSRIHRTVTVGDYTRIAAGTVIGERASLGTWTKIEAGAVIGERVSLGDWSEVGAGSVVGPDVTFGPWARVGRGVTLDAGVRLGSHTRVQDGVTVPDGAVFNDFDLVTPEGVILNRTGGSVTSFYQEGAMVSGPFGSFLIPLVSHADEDELIDQIVEEYQWGRSGLLEAFRVPHLPPPGMEQEAFRDAFARHLGAQSSKGAETLDDPEPEDLSLTP